MADVTIYSFPVFEICFFKTVPSAFKWSLVIFAKQVLDVINLRKRSKQADISLAYELFCAF